MQHSSLADSSQWDSVRPFRNSLLYFALFDLEPAVFSSHLHLSAGFVTPRIWGPELSCHPGIRGGPCATCPAGLVVGRGGWGVHVGWCSSGQVVRLRRGILGFAANYNAGNCWGGIAVKPIHIFHLPEGPDIEAIQPGDQRVVEGSGLWTSMKDGCDRGGVVKPKPGPSGAGSVPPQRPTWGEMDMGDVEQERLVDQDHLPEELVIGRGNCTPVDTRMSYSGPQCPRQQKPALILILCSLLCSFSRQCNNKSRMLRRHF